MESRSEHIDKIARKIRAVVAEYGEASIRDAVIISPYDLGERVLMFRHVYCPTIQDYKLADVGDFKACRCFEDA